MSQIPVDYVFKTDPYKHQAEEFFKSRNMPVAAIHWDPGLGKTKLVIDTAAWAWQNGAINGMLVIAPNKVHTNWLTRELPVHLPDYVECERLVWGTMKYTTKKFQRAFDRLLKTDKFAVMAVNVEAFSSGKAAEFVEKFVRSRTVLGVVDESTRIKNPKAKRTKQILKLSKHMAMRRILTGTPVTKSPFDLYAPFQFLDKDIIGFKNYFAFCHYYGIFQKEKNWGTGQEYEKLIQYMNLDELKAEIAPYTFERKKEDCLDLPEKINRVFYVQPTEEQKKLYIETANSLYLEYEGEEISTQIAIVRLLRLQQINGGFLPKPEESHEWIDLQKGNPKMDALMELVQDVPEDQKVIIWARFIPELKMAQQRIEEMFPGSTGLYIGDTTSKERDKIIDEFENPDSKLRFFIGSPGAGGIGLTLNQASHVFRLSNSFDLEERIQSDDRNYRIGQKNNVVYTDLVIPGTIDDSVLEALIQKVSIAQMMSEGKITVLEAIAPAYAKAVRTEEIDHKVVTDGLIRANDIWDQEF